MNVNSLKEQFNTYKENHLFGRYITSEHIFPLLKKYEEIFNIESIGTSVLGEPIHVINIGTGKRKILMWSQMHGNESTTTKAIFDLCNTFTHSDSSEIKNILTKCSIAIIPILNPDGAKAYTRVNANNVDLNRDAQDLTQPESRILWDYFNLFKPDFCFNLHGQRTIFSAGHTDKSATVSFLSPAQDQKCTITETRKIAMEIIVKMNEHLKIQIPNQVGIYDDTFNINCVGDTFQSLNVPTILFEAGHYPKDYDREVVRELIFDSLIVSIDSIASNTYKEMDFQSYGKIPQNQKLFYDIIIRNAKVNNKNLDIAVQYQEKLIDNSIVFIPLIVRISDLSHFYGHKEIDANGVLICTLEKKTIYEGYENDFVLLNNKQFSLKL